MRLLDRRIILVTGKGGVGKTTVAVGMARALARAGRRVLLSEIGDPEGGYSAVGRHFGVDTFGPKPKPIGEGIMGGHLWARDGHEGFLSSILPAGPLVRAAVRSKALSKFLTAAPSFHEMGVFYHLLMLIRETLPDGQPRFEHIIVDMPATGHALALTGLPEILLRLIPRGPMAAALKEGQNWLNDPKTGAAWIVALPEQLPITESIELLAGLRETNMPAGAIIVNRFPPDPFTVEERAALEGYLSATPVHGELSFRRVADARREVHRLDEVSCPVLELPELPDGEVDEGIAAALADYT